jgi:hypothetical protein
MRDRLKELADQAGYLPDMFGIGHWDSMECNRFAELIIQECVNILHANERIPEGFFYAKPAFVHELSIKKHFGFLDE